jgi:hypothetical protein
LNIGDTLTLKATVSPDNATYRNLSWKSSNEHAITLDNKGFITAKNAGKVTITVTVDGNKASSSDTITVLPPYDAKSKIENLLGKIDSLDTKVKNFKKANSFLETKTYILSGVLFLLILALFVFIIPGKKKRRDEILYTLTNKKGNKETHRLEEWENEIVEKAVHAGQQNQSSYMPTKSIDNETKLTIKDLQKRIADLETGNRKNETEQKPVTPSSKMLYADSIIGGVFNKITDQPNVDTVFELLLKTPSDKIATFTVYSPAYRRVLRNADFVDGCDKQRINAQPQNLEIENGEATLQDSGKWLITKKAKVKFV